MNEISFRNAEGGAYIRNYFRSESNKFEIIFNCIMWTIFEVRLMTSAFFKQESIYIVIENGKEG